MGIRTTLKNIVKQALGMNKAPAPRPYTPPTPVREPVVAPAQPQPIETKETTIAPTHVEEEPTTHVEEAVAVAPEADGTTTEEHIPEAEEENTAPRNETSEARITESKEEIQKESPKESSAKPSPSKAATVSTEGAFAVFEIKRLFGESCPSCEASTSNNWAYSDNSFVCQSCEATL